MWEERLMQKVDTGQIIACHFNMFRQHSVGRRVQMRVFEQRNEIRDDASLRNEEKIFN